MRAPKQDEAKPAGKQDDMKAPKQEEAKPATEPARPDHPEARQEARPDNARQYNALSVLSQRARKLGGQITPTPPPSTAAFPTIASARISVENITSTRPTHRSSGRPQFQYGGYSFVLADAWPADWSYDDDCYIDYIDGEFSCLTCVTQLSLRIVSLTIM